MTKLIIFSILIIHYSPSGLPTKLGRAHDPPFGPKNRADHTQMLGLRSRAVLSSTEMNTKSSKLLSPCYCISLLILIHLILNIIGCFFVKMLENYVN